MIFHNPDKINPLTFKVKRNLNNNKYNNYNNKIIKKAKKNTYLLNKIPSVQSIAQPTTHLNKQACNTGNNYHPILIKSNRKVAQVKSDRLVAQE